MAVKFEVKTKDDGRLARALRSLKSFSSASVHVGFLRGVQEHRKGDPLTNALLGYVHEFGSDAAGIPARPFLMPALDSKRKDASERIEKALAKASDGDLFAVPQALAVIGTDIRDTAKENIIASAGMAPLKPSTLKARQRAGFKGTKPLIRTAQLLNAITYKVS